MKSTRNANAQEPIVRESGKGKFAQEISIGKHALEGDEPIASGGNDLGPSPYDFLLAALGTCTSMTVRMYATLKKIPLDKITVTLTHDKVYAQDCIDCDEKSKIDRLTRGIKLEGDLTEEQRQRLLEIANKCPVHRTLTSKIEITTELV
jgi:putative redox protein